MPAAGTPTSARKPSSVENISTVLGAGCSESPVVIDGLSLLPDHLDTLGIRRPLLVLSEDAVSTDRTRELVNKALARVQHAVFTGFTPNPTIEECTAAASAASAHEADGIIAIGGGTAIDIGKLAAIGANDPSRLTPGRISDESTSRAALPIVAVPTTSGTGAEATHFAAVYIDGIKKSVASPELLPGLAVLETSFQLTMPRSLAAVTGLDALCQSLESAWAVEGGDRSRSLALRAGRLIANSLQRSVLGGDPADRRQMMVGSHLAGRAINLSKTTLSHALSYRLTQRYGTPHGHAVALTLGAVARANALVSESDCADPSGPDEVTSRVRTALSLINATPETAIEKIRELLVSLHLSPTLAGVGVPKADLHELASAVDPVRMSNNPRQLDHAGLVDILERSWDE